MQNSPGRVIVLATNNVPAYSSTRSAHLPLTSLLWLFTDFRLFVYFEVNAGVSYFLDYVEDIYDDGPLCPV